MPSDYHIIHRHNAIMISSKATIEPGMMKIAAMNRMRLGLAIRSHFTQSSFFMPFRAFGKVGDHSILKGVSSIAVTP